MKKHLVIIEDNYDKFFITKQLIEAKLRIKPKVQTVINSQGLFDAIHEITPKLILVKPLGGVIKLLEIFKKRDICKRNTDITIIVTSDIGSTTAEKLKLSLNYARKPKYANAA